MNHDYNIMSEDLDWMSGQTGRTPRESPYAYDAYYLWRSFRDKSNIPTHDTIYTDRMMQWDSSKFIMATDEKLVDTFGTLGNLGSWRLRWSKQQANIIAQRYWGSDHRCIGYGLCANVSSGYEIGIMLVQSPEQQKAKS